MATDSSFAWQDVTPDHREHPWLTPRKIEIAEQEVNTIPRNQRLTEILDILDASLEELKKLLKQQPSEWLCVNVYVWICACECVCVNVYLWINIELYYYWFYIHSFYFFLILESPFSLQTLYKIDNFQVLITRNLSIALFCGHKIFCSELNADFKNLLLKKLHRGSILIRIVRGPFVTLCNLHWAYQHYSFFNWLFISQDVGHFLLTVFCHFFP